ncbi:FkbM family methyltransferase [Alphaproteobacteria bacterium]|nr:FkbM family methyltransferase [Alphaproteobacteria bacterium]
MINIISFIGNFFFFLFKNYDLSFDKKEQLYKLKDKNLFLYSYSLIRLRRFYRSGIRNRLDTLFNEYLLHNLVFNDADTIIDCGANIGELYLYFLSYKKINYIGIEPSPLPFKCLRQNVKKQTLINVALSDKSGTSKFYIEDTSADSSLITNTSNNNYIDVSTRTIDSIVIEKKINKIKLLKIDGEGTELSILKGSLNSLSLIEYISVDLGEEGIHYKSTLPQCCNFILNNKFEIIDFNPKRSVVLFKNIS